MVLSSPPTRLAPPSTRPSSYDGWTPDPSPARCSTPSATTPTRGTPCRSLWSPSPPSRAASSKPAVRCTPPVSESQAEAGERERGDRTIARDRDVEKTQPKSGDSVGEGRSLDYSQHYINTGLRPQNFIRAAAIDEAHADNPRHSRLLSAKAELLQARQLPPFYLDADLRSLDLSSLQCRFDVIYVDPPWEEYARRPAGGAASAPMPCVWSYEDIASLNIESIADTFCVLFLWCGSGGRFLPDRPSHLEEGHRLLQRWGFRRVEDICWLKTNKSAKTAGGHSGLNCLLTRTKEHCLVGMKGPFRRSRDGHLVHANVHTDILISEEPSDPCSTAKPVEAYRVIEDFCLGRRRIELFGGPHSIRPGWVTVGRGLGASNFNPRLYQAALAAQPGRDADGKPCPAHLIGSTREIEDLRPKTPPPAGKDQQRSHHHHRPQQSSAAPSSASGPRSHKRPVWEDMEEEKRGRRSRAYSTSDLTTPVTNDRCRRPGPFSPDEEQEPRGRSEMGHSSSSSRLTANSLSHGRADHRGSRGRNDQRRRRRSNTPSPPPRARRRSPPPPPDGRQSRGRWEGEAAAGRERSRRNGERDWPQDRRGSGSSSSRGGLPSFSP